MWILHISGFRLLYIIPYSTIPQARRICTKNFAVSGVFSPGYGDFQLFAQIPKRLARHERVEHLEQCVRAQMLRQVELLKELLLRIAVGGAA